MLNLNARVHFDEHVLPRPRSRSVQQEFHRAGIHITHRTGKGDGIGEHFLSDRRVEVLRWGNFNHLLVAALKRTVPLKQVNRVTRGVSQNLNLDVTGSHHGLFDEHPVITKRRGGFSHGGL